MLQGETTQDPLSLRIICCHCCQSEPESNTQNMAPVQLVLPPARGDRESYDPFKVNVEILALQFVRLTMALSRLVLSRVCNTLQL